MANVIQRYKTAQEALENFKQGLDDFELLVQKDAYTREEYRRYRDSLVKRFELSVDTLWKYIKFYLQENTGLVHNNPKAVLREAGRAGLLNEQNTSLAIEMVDSRNDAVHIYREAIAEHLLERLPVFYQLMNKLIMATIK